jgi:hypothetical protein
MPQFALIGLAGGFASAVLFMSATAGGPMGRVFLYFLAPLPSFLAGLGWGAPSALIAALAASAGIGVVLGGIWPALVFLISQGLPIVILCHLALLNRPIGSAPPDDSEDGSAAAFEWYPVGRLLAAAALIAGSLSVMSLLLLGGDLEQVRNALREVIEKVFAQDLAALRDKPLTHEEIDALAHLGLYLLPAASATSWLAGFSLNLWLAGRITQASGRLTRPWPDLAAMTFPPGMAWGLVIAIAFTFLPGYLGLISSGFAGAMVFAYMLMGLAIIHYVTRGKAQRPFILWSVYFLLLLFNSWMAAVIALLAIAEPISPLKRWPSSSSGPPAQRGPD